MSNEDKVYVRISARQEVLLERERWITKEEYKELLEAEKHGDNDPFELWLDSMDVSEAELITDGSVCIVEDEDV
jgi:hypothetical protein